MNPSLSPLSSVAVLVQGNPFGGLLGTAQGLLAMLVAGLLGLTVAYGTCLLIWRLFESMFKDPTLGKLLGIVASLCAAVALVGAAPGFVSASYTWGRSLGAGTATTGAPAAPAEAGQ